MMVSPLKIGRPALTTIERCRAKFILSWMERPPNMAMLPASLCVFSVFAGFSAAVIAVRAGSPGLSGPFVLVGSLNATVAFGFPSSFMDDAQDLLQGREALLGFREAVLQHGHHAGMDCGLLYIARVRPRQELLFDV